MAKTATGKKKSVRKTKVKSKKAWHIFKYQQRYELPHGYDACKYNKKWHSKLPIIKPSNVTRNTHYVCYGASCNNWCYAVAIWSSPIAQNRFKDGKTILELRRMLGIWMTKKH